MKLNPKAFALASGIVWGVSVYLVTVISLVRGGEGKLLSRLAMIYPGYSFSFGGGLLGLLWGFVSMFVAGWVLAWLYNRFSSANQVSG